MRNTTRDKVLQEIKVDQPTQLLDFLVQKEVRKSRNAVKSLLAHKQIKVNGKLITQFDFELKAKDKVSVMKYDQSRKEKRLKGLKIVFEDDDLLVIEKEAGFLSVATDKEKSRTVYNSLNEYVKKKIKSTCLCSASPRQRSFGTYDLCERYGATGYFPEKLGQPCA